MRGSFVCLGVTRARIVYEVVEWDRVVGTTANWAFSLIV